MKAMRRRQEPIWPMSKAAGVHEAQPAELVEQAGGFIKTAVLMADCRSLWTRQATGWRSVTGRPPR
jgi:hypothetical protein